ncbi:hypothetical protein KIH41_02160 [Litoribacter ruber]|uniref:hypothetical protein n=1 Tax=Litoribacter ruber TaxID=702568 RepID=UPI001BDA966B|nr:hypothetical protein [Litoribacter ruber]MBT0810083.1 hypothetical protein [Litoribacter ruber]
MDAVMILLLIMTIYITFTPPGLHYLMIIYSAVVMLFLNFIRLLMMIKKGRKSVVIFFPFITVVMIFISAILSPDKDLLARILASISCLIMLFVAFDFYKPNNIIHMNIDKVIKYFSVDFESQGWDKNKNN